MLRRRVLPQQSNFLSPLTRPTFQGGIAITPNSYPWAHVSAIFALHDDEADKQWLAQWTQKDWKVGLDLAHSDTTYLQRQVRHPQLKASARDCH